MKQFKIFVFTFFALLFISNNGFCQSNKSHKDNGHHNGSKNKSNDEYYDNNKNNSNKHVKVNDLIGKNPDYVYKELKNRNFIINRHYLDGLATCKVWHNYTTGQCIKTMSLGKKVYSIENSSNCR